MKDPRCIVGWHHFAQPPATDRTSYDPAFKLECTRCKKSKVIKYANTPITGGGPLNIGGGG